MTLRKLLFWIHLIAGTVAGAIILIMSVTGVALTYERQIVNWTEQRYRTAVPASSTRLPVSVLLERVQHVRPALPSAITVRSDPAAPVEFGYGREATLFVNPYSGAVLGDGSQGVRPFFRAVTDWHRWLAMSGGGRGTGRAITGACNLLFLLLVVSGFYLWWPKQWTWQRLRPVSWFRAGLAGKARDFNWHNVAGLWGAAPLFLIVLSGVIMSYPWANNLLYTLTGSTPPVQAGGPPGGGPGRGPGRGLGAGSGDGPRRERARGGDGRREAAKPSLDQFSQIDASWAKVERQATGWRSISLRLPASPRAPWSYSIDRGSGAEPEKRVQLTLDSATLEVTRTEDFAGYELGRKLRLWARFVHTGEEFGAVGQTVAGVASAGGALLVWTGIALTWRRFRNWRSRRA
jgi:uncharacterized iron-regulated membrane protein